MSARPYPSPKKNTTLFLVLSPAPSSYPNRARTPSLWFLTVGRPPSSSLSFLRSLPSLFFGLSFFRPCAGDDDRPPPLFSRKKRRRRPREQQSRQPSLLYPVKGGGKKKGCCRVWRRRRRSIRRVLARGLCSERNVGARRSGGPSSFARLRMAVLLVWLVGDSMGNVQQPLRTEARGREPNKAIGLPTKFRVRQLDRCALPVSARGSSWMPV